MNQQAHPTTTPARTCDALGVRQHRATPCAGCSNTHPAYHHLHRVHHSPATAEARSAALLCYLALVITAVEVVVLLVFLADGA